MKITILLVSISLIIIGTFMATGYSEEKNRQSANHIEQTTITDILSINENSFYVGETKILIGPKELISKQAAPFDYDGDTVIETIQTEFNDLIDNSITVSGHLNEDNSLNVVMINNLPLPPPHPIGEQIPNEHPPAPPIGKQ